MAKESPSWKAALRAAVAGVLALAVNAGAAWGLAQISTKGERRAGAEAQAPRHSAVARGAVPADPSRS